MELCLFQSIDSYLVIVANKQRTEECLSAPFLVGIRFLVRPSGHLRVAAMGIMLTLDTGLRTDV